MERHVAAAPRTWSKSLESKSRKTRPKIKSQNSAWLHFFADFFCGLRPLSCTAHAHVRGLRALSAKAAIVKTALRVVTSPQQVRLRRAPQHRRSRPKSSRSTTIIPPPQLPPTFNSHSSPPAHPFQNHRKTGKRHSPPPRPPQFVVNIATFYPLRSPPSFRPLPSDSNNSVTTTPPTLHDLPPPTYNEPRPIRHPCTPSTTIAAPFSAPPPSSMAAAKSDRLHKRLHAAGLSSDICDKYVRTLRAFLQARMTKTRFDTEITTLLPPDKRHVHNAIIHDLILRILHKREGLPDLPVLAPFKDKRPSTSSRPLKQPNKAIPSATSDAPSKGTSSPTSLLKRPLHVSDDTRKPDNSLIHDSSQPDTKRPKPRPFDGAKPHLDPIMTALPLPSSSLDNNESKATKRGKVKTSAAAIADKLSSDNRKERRQAVTPLSNNLPPPSPTVSVAAAAAAAAAQPPPRVPPVTSPELETYDGLSFLPSRPGAAMDFELFSKLKLRIRSLVEAGELVGVKDDGVALLAHAVEVQVKRLLEAAITTRRRRSGKRPVGNFSCAPVRPFDLHESAVGNIDLLADESVISLERLSMLL